MSEYILKSNWERFKKHISLDLKEAECLIAPYTKEGIDRFVLLSDGCANTNYKVTFKNNRPPVVLRLYTREKAAIEREVAIHRRVSGIVPVPGYLYVDGQCSYYSHPYVIMEWIDGQLMRDVILSKNEQDISDCVFDAGEYLDKLRHIKFSQGGFFSADLEIRPFSKEEGKRSRNSPL